jgi:predicted ATPase
MLTQFRVENFKSWKDTGEIRMAPLTGFFGTNSSGKTAILQFLLMLKQTVESSDSDQVLNFGNENTYVDLGTTGAFVHQHQFPASIAWSLDIQLNFKVEIQVSGSDSLDFRHESLEPVSSIRFKAQVHLDTDELYLSRCTYMVNPLESANSNNEFGAERTPNGSYRLIDTKSLNNDLVQAYVDKHYKLDFSWNPQPKLELAHMLSLHGYANLCNQCYEFGFERVYYLGPIRDYPKRFYGWSGEKPQDVGRRGENTIAALLTARKQDPEIEIKIAHWLKVMGLIDDFKVDLIAPEQRLYQASVRIAPGGTYCPITDVGFGVSQILPVLVLCYYVPKGSTIIFEQPEIHLHPSAQQKLADVFIDVIKHRELQIIIESHSEHLLHRLQRRIAEEELAPEQAALYFAQMERDGASSLTELALDTFGNITNWPKNFFGDEMGDLVAMTDAAMKRQMAQEAN